MKKSESNNKGTISDPRGIHGASFFRSSKYSSGLGNHIKDGIERVEVVLSGRGWVPGVGGHLREVTTGDLIWHHPGDMTIKRTDPGDPYACLNIVFDSPTIALGGPRRVRRFSRWEDLDSLNNFADQLIILLDDENFDRVVLTKHAFSRLLLEVNISAGRAERGALPIPLQHCLRIFQSRFNEQLKLEQVARAVGWSLPHLHSEFKVHLDSTPHQEIIRRRVHAARRMLMASNEPVKYVAFECGFGSVSAFCYTFRKHAGMTPLDFRNRFQN